MIANSLHCVPFAQYPNYRFRFDPVLNYSTYHKIEEKLCLKKAQT